MFNGISNTIRRSVRIPITSMFCMGMSRPNDDLRVQMYRVWSEVRFHVALYHILSRVSKQEREARLLFGTDRGSRLPTPFQSRRGILCHVLTSFRRHAQAAC